MAKKEIRLYKCSECGYQSQTFMGKCPKCGSWGTLEQEAQPAVSHGPLNEPVRAAVPISGLEVEEQERIPSGIDELDRVLGGGWVRGGVTLLGGEPGVGKSTLLLQVCAEMAKRGERVIYISGEESSGQLALRGRRLGLMTPGLDLLCESDLPSSLAAAEKYGYGFMVIDSVQAFRADTFKSARFGARFPNARSENFNTVARQAACRVHDLLFGFCTAGPCYDDRPFGRNIRQ